jgi:hypothetical protein
MALVNIDTVLHEVKRYLKNCCEGGGLEIMSYKRNRTVAIIRHGNRKVLVREEGYQSKEWLLGEDDLPKKLKSLFKREFPRSRKLRLCKFDNPEQLDRIHQKI